MSTKKTIRPKAAKKSLVKDIAKKYSPTSSCIFESKEIKSVKDLIDVANELGSDWWFRGLRSSDYKLQTSLGRHLEKNGYRNFDTNAKKVEKAILEDFQANASSYIFSSTKDSYLKEVSGKNSDVWFWLFTMQHYEIPTRLLDWTISPIIGLWFAVNDWKGFNADNTDTDAVLYALNPTKYITTALKIHQTERPPFLYTDDAHLRPIIQQFNPFESVLMAHTISSLPVIGLFNNDRIKAQKGRFTISKDPTACLKDELKKNISFSNNAAAQEILRSYTIKAENVKKIRKEIAQLGISYADIIPDLSGVAKSFVHDIHHNKKDQK